MFTISIGGIAATMSSSIIPKPPLIFLSTQFIGKGFLISKKRKRIKAITKFNKLISIQIRIRSMATISSITILEGSFIFKFELVISQARKLRKNKVVTNSICNSFESGAIIKNIGNAKVVPKVPGAFGVMPNPKPKARKCQKLLIKNLKLSKMRKTLFLPFY